MEKRQERGNGGMNGGKHEKEGRVFKDIMEERKKAKQEKRKREKLVENRHRKNRLEKKKC